MPEINHMNLSSVLSWIGFCKVVEKTKGTSSYLTPDLNVQVFKCNSSEMQKKRLKRNQISRPLSLILMCLARQLRNRLMGRLWMRFLSLLLQRYTIKYNGNNYDSRVEQLQQHLYSERQKEEIEQSFSGRLGDGLEEFTVF